MGRWDFDVYNEATGFVITSRERGGRDCRRIAPRAWVKAIEDGVMLVVPGWDGHAPALLLRLLVADPERRICLDAEPSRGQ